MSRNAFRALRESADALKTAVGYFSRWAKVCLDPLFGVRRTKPLSVRVSRR